MVTTITVETLNLPISKYRVSNPPKKIMIIIDEKEGIIFEDVTNNQPDIEAGAVPIPEQSVRTLPWASKRFERPIRTYITRDKKIGESIATAVGPGGVQSKFDYYIDDTGGYYSVRLGPKGYNRFKLGRLDDPSSRIAQIHQDTQRFRIGKPFNQTDIEKSETLPYNIKINRSILKSALEILEILGYLERVKDKERLSQKFERVKIEEVALEP